MLIDILKDLMTTTLTFKMLDFAFWVVAAFFAGAIVAIKRGR